MKMRHVYILSLMAMFMIAGCGSQKDEGVNYEPIAVERADLMLHAIGVGGECDSAISDGVSAAVIDDYALLMSQQIKLSPNADMSDKMLALSRSKAVEMFVPEVIERIPDFSERLESPLGKSLGYFEQELDGFNAPCNIGVIVSPYNQAVYMFGDSVVLVASNHYLGENFDGYSVFDAYQRRYKDEKYAALNVSDALLRRYVGEGETSYVARTLLERMLHEGAIVEVLKRSNVDWDISQILGYSEAEMAWLEEHEKDLWERIVGDGLLYTTNERDQSRLLDPAPVSTLLGPDVPGRVGRYVGWRIVDSYIQQQPMSSEQLLNEDFARDSKVLVASRYAPQNRVRRGR